MKTAAPDGFQLDPGRMNPLNGLRPRGRSGAHGAESEEEGPDLRVVSHY